jgi:hypothetical protein
MLWAKVDAMGPLQSVFQLFTKQLVATGSSCQGEPMTRKVMIKLFAAKIAKLAQSIVCPRPTQVDNMFRPGVSHVLCARLR